MTEEPRAEPVPEEDESWPIGFMVIVGLAALYVGWRLIQLIWRGIDWLL